MAICRYKLSYVAGFCLFSRTVEALGLVASSTAAWSSQIVAFWGAIVVAFVSYRRRKITSAPSSLLAAYRIRRRTLRIAEAVARENWFIHSGWRHGQVRTDVVIIRWKTPGELRRLSRRVAMQIDVFAGNWEVLIVGRKVTGSADDGNIHWIKHPRSDRLCTSKLKETGENMYPLQEEDVLDAAASFREQRTPSIDEVINDLYTLMDRRPTRCAFMYEIATEIQSNDSFPSFATTFTGIGRDHNAYLALEHSTGLYGTERSSILHSATFMCCAVHMMVTCAVGLMGVASGRGLSVWLMVIRPALRSLGAEMINGNDIIPAMVSLDKARFQYESASSSDILAGDITSSGMALWIFMATYSVPFAEIMIITAGWLYGALHAEKLPPAGVVGHGMLALSTLTSLSLSIRALYSIRKRLSGRLVGLWHMPNFLDITIGVRSLEVPVSQIQSDRYDLLVFIARILREGGGDHACLVAEAALRLPITGNLLREHIVTDILQYQYEGDHIVCKGDPPQPVTVRGNYPWIQTGCCVVATFLCTCASTVYAYLPLPSYVKIVTEVVATVSVTWFVTLELVSDFPHDRDTFISLVVANLLTSSIWYVGIRDVADVDLG